MDLQEQTWTDVRDTDADAAVLPVGSTEQHGPHAPLGTDSIAAEAIADRGAEACEQDVLVAPTIPVGIAEEHRAFDGTLWVTEDAFRAYLSDVLRSLSAVVDRVVVVNGHGGNTAAVREVCARVTRDGEVAAAAFTWFDAISTDLPIGHGGPVETSIVLALRPELVHEDRYEAAREGMGDTFGEWVAGTNIAYDVETFAPSGTVGDPGEASAETGADVLRAAGRSLATVLDALRDRQKN